MPKNSRAGIHLRKVTYTSPILLFLNKNSPTFQISTDQFLLSSPMGMGPTSQELPNQLVLQTRYRNVAAKSCTLNS